jgi:hypothetical protein
MTAPTQPTLADLVRMAREQAERILIGTTEELMPLWHIVPGDGSPHVIVGTPFEGGPSKDMVAFAVSKLMRDHQAVKYAFMSEAWMATVKQEDWNEDGDNTPPSERPDRIEIVMVLAQGYDEPTIQRAWKILRGEDGKTCIGLEEMPDPGYDGIQGRFANLLPPRSTPTKH